MRTLVTSEESTAGAKTEPWGRLCWLASEALGNAQNLTLGRVIIKKGESNPRHAHPACEEILYVLRGQLEHTVGDECYSMQAGDTITIPPGVLHNAVSVGTVDADMIVVYSSGARDFQLEQRD